MSRQRYTYLPACVIERGVWADLSPSAAKLLAVFYHHLNAKSGNCWPAAGPERWIASRCEG